ncbi:TonB-dependent receptor plug domain-containing protein [Imperialibacter roseus]|uniref:TonB-dependent receptor plug domain-containing protein n=1 Tax=Imperialibacter roseus TaxID=1324217 RepID=A0ABZ0IT79_9BACT|nr:TonB-dependent receptor plug domain-containing protein [Imperialibacter roseus]WOK07349.1 TonB-dependent receptor plug domain-containing protein [Imperialibacter roseus]
MRAFFLLAASLLSFSCISQAAGGQNLLQAIAFFESEAGVKFSYDPEVLGLIDRKFDTKNTDLPSFIETVENSLPLTIDQVNEQHYTISLAQAEFHLIVTDSTTREAIFPEMGGVLLLNGQPVQSVQSNDEWTFSYKPSVRDSVEVYVPGYVRQRITFRQLLNSTHLTLPLSLITLHLKKVVIEDYLTSGINMDPAGQSISIHTADLPLLPGETDGDLFASLAALPGITTPDNRPGNLFIRGSSTDQSLILFDNIPIYHRGHYFGTISPYNPKVVEEVKVYRNGYHPRMGGRVGGAVEIQSDHQPALHPKTGLGTNSLYAMGYTKVPLAGKKVGISLGARRSYPYSFSSPKLRAISQMVFAASALTDSAGKVQENIDVLFEDYHARITFQPNRKNELYFTSIFTRSKTEFTTNVPEENQVKNVGFNFQWKYAITRKAKSSLSVTVSDYDYSYLIGMAIQNATPGVSGGYSLNGIKDYSIQEEVDIKLPNANSLQTGVDYQLQQTYFKYSLTNPRDTIPVILGDQAEAQSFSPFANFEWNSLRKLYAQIGVRATYYDLTNNLQVTPRLFVNYYPHQALTLKGSLGWYRQYLSQVKNLEFSSGGFDNELWLLARANNNIISGTQAMVGGVVSVNSWIFDLEGYYKTADNVTYHSDKRFYNNRGIYLTADHAMYGVDFFIKKKVNESVAIWTGYSWNQSKVALDSALDITYDSKYSQPNVFYLGGLVERGRWKLSAGWRLNSGLTSRSLDMIQAENLFLEETSRRQSGGRPGGNSGLTNPFDALPYRYPAVHMLDISASYTIPPTEERRLSATFGVSLINAYNQVNMTDIVTRKGNPVPRLKERDAIQFAPNLMVMIEW